MANTTDPTASAEQAEWHTVSAKDKKRVLRKQKTKTKKGVLHATAANVTSVTDMAVLGRIVQACRQALQATRLYQEILEAAADVTPHEILCYGLGNFSQTHPVYFSACLWQLALLLQMRDDFQANNGDATICVYFYDPASTETEIAFLKQQQIQVLSQDEQGKRTMAEKTFAFLPHCPAILYENLFQTNPTAFTSLSSLLIGNSIRNFCEALSPTIDMPSLRARVDGLEERRLTVDKGPPGDFEKAFNDTFIIRGKRVDKHDNAITP